MNRTLLRALILLAPVCWAPAYSGVLTFRKIPFSRMQLAGAMCLLVVVLAHVCEALGWLPLMNWGAQDSAGHYLNLASAALGVTLFPAGYALRAIRASRS